MRNLMISKLLSVVVIIGFIFCVFPNVRAEEKQDSTAQDEIMAKAMELAQPGEEHKLLERLTGEWNAETKMWMSPGADPMILPGKAGLKMILDGRFLYGEYSITSDQMKGDGLFVTGFDRRHEKFTYIGFDTWGTYSVSASGTYDEETKSITMYGEDVDPIMGHTQKYNLVFTFNSDDTWKFEVIFLDKVHTQGGDQFKMVEVNYIRAE
ncbi:MAG: DUF1579 family protein [candidate division Zixibacteria bacterium]